jgi:hypothetical protein
MPADDQQPYVEPQRLNDIDTYVYETIATLEYQGRPVTRDKVLAVTDIDDAAVSETLRRLTENRVLVATDSDDGPRYELARRDWSVTPDIPEHQPGRLWPQH